MPIGPLNVDSSLRVETTGRGRTERRIDSELGRIGVRNGPNIAPPFFLGRSVAAAGPPLFLGMSRRDSNRQHRSGRRGAEDRARGSKRSAQTSRRGIGARLPHLPHPCPPPEGSARDFLSSIEKSRFAAG